MSNISTEDLQRFRELHPERYAELLEEAKRTANQPRPPHRVYTTHKFRGIGKPPLTAEEIYAICYKPNHKHFLITTSDGHRYFESSRSPDDAIIVAQRHPNFYGTVTNIEECTQPCCASRQNSLS